MIKPLLADRESWFQATKTINGEPLDLVAIQKSRRTRRKGKSTYVYVLLSTGQILYNHSRGGVMFMPIAPNETIMKKYFKIFVGDTNDRQTSLFRQINGYELV